MTTINFITNKKLLNSLLLCIMISACSPSHPSKTVVIMTYKDFRSDQHSFKSQDGVIKYIDKGNGPVVLLLHGIPSSSWLYRKMINGIADNGYRVIAPDMLGFGNSDNPKSYEIYSSEFHARRIIELMDDLNIDKWHHVMHDAGGLWTWELIKHNKERIDHLIILNSIIYEEGFHPPIRMKKGAFGKFSMWLYRNGVTTNFLLKQLFKKGLKKNDLTEADIEGYKKPLVEGKTHDMYYFFTQTCNLLPNYESTLNSLQIPTTVIWGKHDKMLRWLPQRNKITQQLKIDETDIHLLDAKHFIQEEKPDSVNQIILKFINR